MGRWVDFEAVIEPLKLKFAIDKSCWEEVLDKRPYLLGKKYLVHYYSRTRMWYASKKSEKRLGKVRTDKALRGLSIAQILAGVQWKISRTEEIPLRFQPC